MNKYYYSECKEIFICYSSTEEISNENEMLTFMASSLEFGIGHTKENALEDLNFNLAEIKKIKLQG